MNKDRAIQRLARQHEKTDRAEQDEGLRQLCSSYAGRRFLWHLLGFAKLYTTAFAPNALQMSFNCGEQNIALYLLARITEVAPEAYLLMTQENQNVERERANSYAKHGDFTDADSAGDGDAAEY